MEQLHQARHAGAGPGPGAAAGCAGSGRVVAALVGIAGLVTAIVIFALMLLVALRDVGVSDDEVGWAEVLAVFAFARLVTAIPITPGWGRAGRGGP